VEDTYVLQEKRLIRRLEQMLVSYRELMDKLEKDEEEMNYRGHSEMAMMHDWWEEIDEKIHATEALLKLLKGK
jgi:ribonucleotide reductase alpha subunit